MSDFQIISKNNENFVVDWDVIERLLKSIYTTQYQLINSTINPMKPSGEFHLHEEVLWTVDVDWDSVAARTARDIKLEMPDLRSWAKVDPKGMAKELEHRVELAGGFRQDFLDKLKWVSGRNVQNIDKAVAAYDADIKLLRLVRDTAADLFVVAATGHRRSYDYVFANLWTSGARCYRDGARLYIRLCGWRPRTRAGLRREPRRVQTRRSRQER